MKHQDVKEIVISATEVENKIKELGKILDEEYKGKYPLLIGVLNGCVPFMMKLIEHMEIDLEYEFIDISSYSGTASGELKILKDVNVPLQGRHVLVIEDIIDTGRTVLATKELLKHRDALSVKVVSLLDKKEKRVVDVEADYVGFVVPDIFVIGYGLDYYGKYRNLNYVGVLKESVYETQTSYKDVVEGGKYE